MITTLTTDFGTADSYVAQMKGVILSLAPETQIIDITHEVKPQDIIGGAFVLAQAVSAFPRGTVHVAVVDPGVGGTRDPIVIETEEALFVGPNNGLLSLAAPVYRAAYRIENRSFLRENVSATFQGRDVFAPTAGHLLRGRPAGEAGPVLPALQAVPWPEPIGDAGAVVHIDRFGNLITNLRARNIEGAEAVAVGTLEAPVGRTYSDVGQGAPIAYIGSSGLVEVGMREASAATWTGAQRGAPVQVKR